MKIGLVRRGYSATGGAERYLLRFATALSEAGHTPVLFASTAWPQDAWSLGPRVSVHGENPGQFAAALERLVSRRHCDFLFSLERVSACDCYRAGDGVHRAWLARRARHEPWIETWFRKLRPMHRELLLLETQLFKNRRARAVIANSALVRDEIVHHFGYPADRIRIIPNGVPAPASTAETAAMRLKTRAELGYDENDPIVLFVGSGWERKGLNYAVHAINAVKNPNAQLLVAGRGNPAECPTSRRTRFLGTDYDVRSLYAAADVFLLPTLYDPFSNACLEAFSYGLPVVTTRDNGFCELLTTGVDGHVLENPADTTGMAQALDTWTTEGRADDARESIRRTASVWTIERNLEATLAVVAEFSP